MGYPPRLTEIMHRMLTEIQDRQERVIKARKQLDPRCFEEHWYLLGMEAGFESWKRLVVQRLRAAFRGYPSYGELLEAFAADLELKVAYDEGRVKARKCVLEMARIERKHL